MPAPTAPSKLPQVNGSDAGDCGLTVHAVLPPPVTGMTLCTEALAAAMSKRMPVRRFNWSNGSAKITNWFRIVKAVRAMSTPFRLLFGSRPQTAVFYMPSNAGLAVVWNILALGAARLRGYRGALHHHYYGYLNERKWRIKLLGWVLGPNGLQIVLCPDMEQRLRKFYGLRLPIAIVPSTIQLLATGFEPENSKAGIDGGQGPFRIGLISNLQMAKGLDTLLEVLRELLRRGRNVQLVLAGPTFSDVEKRLIESAQQEFGPALDYRGPVYNEQKRQFFRDIHVMLFPTRYPDAQPLVITEAFAFGCPAISYGRGCIPGMMGAEKDWSIPPCEDFVAPAVEKIENWMDGPALFEFASQTARDRFDALTDEAQRSMENFERWVRGENVPGFVRRGETPLETALG